MIVAGWEPMPGLHVRHRLGAGGFGEVWEAVTADGEVVALKFLDARKRSPGLINSEIRVLRGLKELRHPNIIAFQAVHVVSHYVIIQMERADGNLSDLQQAYVDETGKNIPTEHCLELLEQAAVALDFLTAQKPPGFSWSAGGMQHCDVKPTNLLLLGEVLKVADFGLCASTSGATHRNSWRGTPPYAAPELYKGAASSRTDQYALAVTYCELCLGRRTFRDINLDAPDMPIDLGTVRQREAVVLARALAPNWTARWPSCREFVAALREAVHGPRRGHRRSSSTWPRVKTRS